MATYNLTFRISESATTNPSNTVYIGVSDLTGTQTDVSTGAFTSLTTQLDAIAAYIDANYNNASATTYETTTIGGVVNIVFTCNLATDPLSSTAGFLFNVNDGSSNVAYVWFNFTALAATTCPTCLELTKVACQTSYTFVAGLTPTTDYWVVIENHRNRRYVQQVTTDGSGDFAIDATAPEFPEGFFIPEQFVYTLKVYTTSALTTEAEITYNNTIYNCIALSFIYSTTTTSGIGGVDLWVDDNLNFVVDDLGNTISVG